MTCMMVMMAMVRHDVTHSSPPLHWAGICELRRNRAASQHSCLQTSRQLRTRHRSSLSVVAMRAVVQRVLSAKVVVDGVTISEIGPGLLVLVGLLESDSEADAEYICRKVLNMRIFQNDKSGKSWDLSVMQRNYEVLLVSQFTLYGILKGNKPDFHVAMAPQLAKPFYGSLVDRFRRAYIEDRVKDGIFGAMMQVHLVNDGPVTLQLDSSKSNGKE